VSESVPAELLAHWLDHYGQCSRDHGKQNDCYWGKDAAGHDNGCLKVGWKGRACLHWTPVSGPELTWLIAAHTYRASSSGLTPDFSEAEASSV
jgi:hypothetical protein